MTLPYVRPIDRWFIEEVLPHERAYLDYANRVARDEAEAGDIVQEAYAKLFTLDGWTAIANPAGYVMRVVRNIAIERHRRAKVVALQPLPAPVSLDVVDEAPDSFRVVAARRQMARVQQAILALPERCRVALVRRRIDGESPSSIATDLGISLSTYEKRLARAVELLTHALTPQERGTEPSRSAEQDHKALL